MSVFISYSHRDATFVDALALHLTSRNIKVWKDTWRNRPGDDFASRVEAALAAVTCVCIALSRSSRRSRWVQRETDGALRRATRDPELLILPLLLDDTPLLRSLAHLLAVDCRRDLEASRLRIVDLAARVENRPSPGRASAEGRYYLDFAFDERVADGRYVLQVDVVSYDTEETYSVLSQFTFSGDAHALTQAFCAGNDSQNALRDTILGRCASGFTAEPARARLRSGQVTRGSFVVHDTTGQGRADCHVRMNCLGRGPRGVLVFNYGALVQQVCETSGIPFDGA